MKKCFFQKPGIILALTLAFVSCDDSMMFGSFNSLTRKLASLEDSAESGGSYFIELSSDERIPPVIIGGGNDIEEARADAKPGTIFIDFGDKENITIRLRGVGANRIISLSSEGAMFTVLSGFTLVLDGNITLKGREGNINSLVVVHEGATLIMNIGSAIIDNSHSWYGGGVNVLNGAAFTMNGGTIAGNNARWGGGVDSSGTFTMNDGIISGNTGGWGSGVNAWADATFTMNGGIIASNNAYNTGGGVCINGGTFTMNGGTITGNSAYDGGGVYITGTFTKTYGTITGIGSGNGNTARAENGGNAVYASNSSFSVTKRRETTVEQNENLSFNARTGAFNGRWDY